MAFSQGRRALKTWEHLRGLNSLFPYAMGIHLNYFLSDISSLVDVSCHVVSALSLFGIQSSLLSDSSCCPRFPFTTNSVVGLWVCLAMGAGAHFVALFMQLFPLAHVCSHHHHLYTHLCTSLMDSSVLSPCPRLQDQ